MNYAPVFWEDVQEGEALPSFTYELSLLRLVAFVRASGLYDYVHFDGNYARAAGARDAFISTPHVAGLFGRLLTDWSGPEANVRSLTFGMRTQSCTDDILTVTGRVGRRYRGEDGAYMVDLADLNIAHAHAPKAVVGSATMALPSRSGATARSLDPVLGRAAHQPLDQPFNREGFSASGRAHNGETLVQRGKG